MLIEYRSEDEILELRWDEGEKPETTLPEDKEGGQDLVEVEGGSGRNSTGGQNWVLVDTVF